MSTFIAIASRFSVLRRGLTCSVIVGTALVAINQGDVIFNRNLAITQLLKIELTYMVPFFVSTLSSVLAIRGREDVRNA